MEDRLRNDLRDYPLLLTAKEAAEIMRVDIRLIRNWVSSNELASTKIGKREYRIPKEALINFIIKQTSKPDSSQ